MKLFHYLLRRKLVYFLISSLLVFLLPQFANAREAKIDYDLLAGEWSKPGQCDRQRFIYRQPGNKYIWAQKKNSQWKNVYQGIYVRYPERNTVVIGDGPNMGGETIGVYELTRLKYRGEWKGNELSFDNPDDAKFTYVRCK
ncbi:hypothetical protein [Altericista sp. CCNU0014]|uniref:hypothetical protein n=1 Tax=Altericista sp. CCNU0014 TaxID=3082949 RepID=UPI00384BD2F8